MKPITALLLIWGLTGVTGVAALHAPTMMTTEIDESATSSEPALVVPTPGHGNTGTAITHKRPTAMSRKSRMAASVPRVAKPVATPMAVGPGTRVTAIATTAPSPPAKPIEDPAPRLAAATPAGAPPASTVPATAPPTAPPSNAVVETKDAHGKVIGTMPNPEAFTPLADSAKSATTESKPRDMLSQIINTILNLALVLVVAYLVLLGIKKYSFSGRAALPKGAAPGKPLLTVLESMTLGPGHKVHLVVVGKRCFLVGQTAQQVNLLHEVTDDPEVMALVSRMASTAAAPAGFSGVLSQFFSQGASTAPTAAPRPEASIPLAQYYGAQRGASGEKERHP